MWRNLAVITMAGALIAAAPITQADVGPAPSWEAAVAAGDAAIKAQMTDPDSAKIEWPYNFIGGTLKARFGKRRAGYWTCGYVNGRNLSNGMAGRRFFLIMINSGAVTSLEIGEADGLDSPGQTCPDAIKRGLLPPAPAPAS